MIFIQCYYLVSEKAFTPLAHPKKEWFSYFNLTITCVCNLSVRNFFFKCEELKQKDETSLTHLTHDKIFYTYLTKPTKKMSFPDK